MAASQGIPAHTSALGTPLQPTKVALTPAEAGIIMSLMTRAFRDGSCAAALIDTDGATRCMLTSTDAFNLLRHAATLAGTPERIISSLDKTWHEMNMGGQPNFSWEDTATAFSEVETDDDNRTVQRR